MERNAAGKHALHLETAPTCRICKDGQELDFAFSYAFQPIIDIASRQIFAHEALIRGPAGEGALTVLQQVTDANRYRFDQACRVKAIRTAARLGMQSRLSINFLPNAIYRPEVCISTPCRRRASLVFPSRTSCLKQWKANRLQTANGWPRSSVNTSASAFSPRLMTLVPVMRA